tara:strand:+ start:638 stop:2152 length:1515 start_codon:yes stop_codon:yes gene_type:complete
MKKLFLLFLFITQITFGQSNIVEISTTGSGETKEEAVQNALLSALKQSFGVFISSNTEIINDVLTKDKISELSSGNILEYNIISETENGDYYNTLVSSKISMNTLASYTKNKVDSNEISGDIFVSNFLIKELNKENELQSIKDLIEYSKKVLPTTLDFYVNSGEPFTVKDEQFSDYASVHKYIGGKRVDPLGGIPKNFPFQFIVESKIGYKQNVKYENWRDHFNRTIKSIVLNEDEISEYVNLNIDTYPFILNNEVLYLRNFSSIQSLIEFYLLSNKSSYHFTLKYNGLDKSYDFKDFFQENLDSIYLNRTRYGMKIKNKFPNDLIFKDLRYAIIENGEIEDFESCDKIFKGPGSVYTVQPGYDPCNSNTNKFKFLNLTEKYGRARFPYFNIIKTRTINSRYPTQKQKSELIYDYYNRKDFPKKLRTKDNYKKIENELLILNQDERDMNYLLNTIYGSNRGVKYDDYTIILQTNLSFDQFMIINSYFTLEELKKFRGFQISNSN